MYGRRCIVPREETRTRSVPLRSRISSLQCASSDEAEGEEAIDRYSADDAKGGGGGVGDEES